MRYAARPSDHTDKVRLPRSSATPTRLFTAEGAYSRGEWILILSFRDHNLLGGCSDGSPPAQSRSRDHLHSWPGAGLTRRRSGAPKESAAGNHRAAGRAGSHPKILTGLFLPPSPSKFCSEKGPKSSANAGSPHHRFLTHFSKNPAVAPGPGRRGASTAGDARAAATAMHCCRSASCSASSMLSSRVAI